MSDLPTFRHALKWAYVATLSQRGIAVLLMFVLAAVLGPEDFGTVAMAGVYIIFIEMLVTQGMGAAIIQRKDLKNEHLDSVFWVILAVSAVLAGTSVAMSPWWAGVNDLPRLSPVIALLSLSIPIKGLTVVQHALLQRNMDYRNLAVMTGASSIAGGAVGVTMAFSGCGVWSLVAQQLVGSALAAAVMWKVSSWRPRFRFSLRHARDLFGFSGSVFASNLGVYTGVQSDVILMGVFFGPVAVGLYRLADRIMDLLLEVTTRSIQNVALPHFSSLQDDMPRLRAALLSCIRLSTAITIPAMTVVAVSSDQLMGVIGAKWAPAASVLKIAVFLGMAKSITLFSGSMLLALGRPKTVAALVWTISGATTAGLVVVSMSLGGAEVLQQITTVAFVKTGLFVLIHGTTTLVVMNLLCGIRLRQLGGALVPGLVAALAALLTAFVVSKGGAPSSAGSFAALLWIAVPAAGAAGITLIMVDQTVRQGAAQVLRIVLLRRGEAAEQAFPTRQD